MIILNKKVIAIIILITLLSAGLFFFQANKVVKGYVSSLQNRMAQKTLNENFLVKIKSGNLSTDYNIEDAKSDIKKFQLNTVNIPVIIDIQNLSSSDMSIDLSSKRKAIELIKKLYGQKINIILEPYPWIQNGKLYETDWKPYDINTFFWNWKTKILRELIDDIAVPYHVDALNIASNFARIEYAEGYWCDTIDYVRKSYKGLVTYRTNWWRTAYWNPVSIILYETKLSNKLFSKVDFISVSAYFELTDNAVNTVENLEQALYSTQILGRKQNIKQELKNFYDKWHKPIFFGELGFPKRNHASTHPWNPFPSNIVNNIEQANCFEAYRRAFENESWHLGFSVFAIGEHSPDKNYYPSSESTAVIKNWYHKVK